MPKVRVELSLDFSGRCSSTAAVVEPSHEALLKEAANKFKLKKKDLAQAALFSFDAMGDPVPLPDDGSLRDGAVVVITAGGPPAPRHLKKVQKGVQELQWVPAGRGHLAARGCPDAAVLAALCEHNGVSGVITLLRNKGERGSASEHVRDACARLGIRWVFAPLSGWTVLVQGRSQDDLESFQALRAVRDCLLGSDGTDRFIVHCSAGLHRTGICFYVLLRMLGDSPVTALAKMQASRQKTRDEFERLRLQPFAEQILEEVEPGTGDTDLLAIAAAGRDGEVDDVEEEDE